MTNISVKMLVTKSTLTTGNLY